MKTANNTLSKYNNTIAGVHYTTAHTGKMKGLFSLSTSCTVNPECIKRHNAGESICKHCFSFAQAKRYKNMVPCFVKNTEILTARILAPSELPTIPETVTKFRFESFGDLCSVNQVINYFNIARNNPGVPCALWTKNPWYIDQAIKAGHEKPENLNIIYSSLLLNKPATVPGYAAGFIDKVFTVYTPEFIEENDVNINCGARSCDTCGRCYRKTGGLEYVSEKLK